ncbi:MAG: GWxTD domain-containing protein [Gemmatimonadota bacterium]
MLYGLLLSFGALGATVPAPPRLAVQAIRYYVPSVKQTQVIGFLQVPYSLTEPAGNRIAWQVSLVIKDAAGTTLGSQSWWSGAPAAARSADAMGMEPLRFPPMAPGSYLVQVTVKDSVSGKTATTQTAVEAFATSPGVSDLLLASAMRRAAPGDSTSGIGEFGRGSYRFITAPDLKLDGANPVLSYLLEAYTDAEASAATTIDVRDAAGKSIYKLPATRQMIPAGGGVIAGQLPLEGLGEGNYKFVVSVALGGRTIERSGDFAVGGLQASLARDIATRSASRGLDEAYFGGMTEEQLDEAAEVLQLIATNKQLAVYKKTGADKLSPTAKRAFLVSFWAERDQNKATPENENRIAFYDAVDYVNKTYGERGRAARPGWKTDRGRIWARNGAPDDNYKRAQEGRAPNIEVWRYTRGRMRYYIFADRNGLSQYQLMNSNDLKEQGLSDWREIVTYEAAHDLGTYLGVNFSGAIPGSGGGTTSPPQ